MTGDAICNDVCLWIKNMGQRQLRVALLSLEPGSRVWLSIDGDEVQFERMADGVDGRSTRGLKPVGATAQLWRSRYVPGKANYVEAVEMIERPSDRDAAGSGYYQREDHA